MSGQATNDETGIDAELRSPGLMVDPYPTYAKLRADYPVFWSRSWNAWVISRYPDVVASLRDNHNLSNENRQGLLFTNLSTEELNGLTELRHYFAQKDVIGSDPPDHTRMRSLVQKAFTPKTVTALEPRVTELATTLIEGALSTSPTFDFIEQVAHPLPVILIAELLGAPPEDRPLFKRWSADILAFQGTGQTTYAVAHISQTALNEMFAYISELIDARRRAPTGDLISELVNAEEHGNRLTRDELLSTCNTLLTAGHETTTNLLGNLLRLLLTYRDQWDRVRAHAELVPGAIEEALRYDAPKQRNFRRVKVAHTFGGARLSEGSLVFQLIGSANRDPAQFPAPDTFDIGRSPNAHASFGMGIHSCLGLALARLEARAVLRVMTERASAVELENGPTVWQERVQFRGPKQLWLNALAV
jgi:cytochrome P450